MQIIINQNTEVHSICFALVLPIGSINEPIGKAGITHLIEHICFRRAAELSQKEIYSFCEERGVKINAKTGKNFLEFSFICRPEIFNEVVELLHKMFYEVNYFEEDILAEKAIVLAEMDGREKDNSEIIIDSLWENKRFSRSILGTIKTLNNINLLDLITYKKEILAADRRVFILGNYSSEQMELVKKLFCIDKIKEQKNIKNKAITKNRLPIKFIKDDYDICDIYYAFHVKLACGQKIENIIALQMLESVLFQGDAAYFSEILREKLGYIYEVYSTVEIICDEAVLLFKVTCGKNIIIEIINEIEKLLNNFIFDSKYMKYLKAFFYDNLDMLYDDMRLLKEQFTSNYINFGISLSPKEYGAKAIGLNNKFYNDFFRELVRVKGVYIFGSVKKGDKKHLIQLFKGN